MRDSNGSNLTFQVDSRGDAFVILPITQGERLMDALNAAGIQYERGEDALIMEGAHDGPQPTDDMITLLNPADRAQAQSILDGMR